MVDKELLEAIGNLMDEKLKPIQADITGIKADLAELKEDHQATRDGVNSLIDWAEECGNVIKFPLPKVK